MTAPQLAAILTLLYLVSPVLVALLGLSAWWPQPELPDSVVLTFRRQLPNMLDEH